MTITIRDYRTKEGRAAASMGYTGPNPYEAGTDSARLWAEGFAQVAQ